MTILWCSGVRLVARLLDRRTADRGREEATLVRHPVSGWAMCFESEPAARRFLERHCCEPSAFEVGLDRDDEARRTAA